MVSRERSRCAAIGAYATHSTAPGAGLSLLSRLVMARLTCRTVLFRLTWPDARPCYRSFMPRPSVSPRGILLEHSHVSVMRCNCWIRFG